MRAAVLTLAAVGLAACNMVADAQENEAEVAAGPVVQRSFAASGFDSVSLGGHHNVVVQVGPAASVRAEGPSEELDRLKIEVEDGDLNIGTKRDKKWSIGSRRSRAVTVYVTMPSIKAAAIGGSGDMRIDKAQGASFSGSIGGSGDLNIGALRVDQADFSIAGSGSIHAAGTAGKTDVSIAGSGDVEIAGLESRTANVAIVGSGGVQARATDTADVSIMGSGDVAITGSAKCTVSKMGSGDVRCGN